MREPSLIQLDAARRPLKDRVRGWARRLDRTRPLDDLTGPLPNETSGPPCLSCLQENRGARCICTSQCGSPVCTGGMA